MQLITFPSLELALVISSQEPSDDCEAALSMKDCTKIILAGKGSDGNSTSTERPKQDSLKHPGQTSWQVTLASSDSASKVVHRGPLAGNL